MSLGLYIQQMKLARCVEQLEEAMRLMSQDLYGMSNIADVNRYEEITQLLDAVKAVMGECHA